LTTDRDKELIRERFEASLHTYDELADVQRRICARLAELCGCGHEVRRGLEIGAGTGFLTRCLIEQWPHAKWFVNDLTPAVEPFITPQVADTQIEYLWGDAERLDYPDALDLVASASTVQWFEDMERFAQRISGALAPSGRLLLSTFGPENFREIRATTGEGLNYLSLSELCVLFERTGMRILHAEEYTETLVFATPRDVLRYIKSLGINSIKKTGWNPGRMDDFEERYRIMFPTPDMPDSPGNDGITLTYHPLLLVAERMCT